MSGLDSLKGLRAALAAQARERAADDERRRQAERAERERLSREAAEARLFERWLRERSPAPLVALPPDNRVVHRARPVEPRPRQLERDERQALAESLSDDIGIEQMLETDDSLSYRRSGIGLDVVRKLRRGHWSIQAQLDLHGYRVDEAREAFNQFIRGALQHELRCVRIIHGKGLGSVGREPVLKGKVIKWLIQCREVMAICQARPNDGGGGALIAMLQSADRRTGSR